jgi:(p)ppGpp synthase/HD superfamily hydrolase
MSAYDLEHGLEVARRCPSDLFLAGLLHDAIEDGVLSRSDLREHFNAVTILAISAVTRRRNEPYDAYIRRVANDPDGRIVKIADLEANLARMDEAHKSLGPRYEKALAYLRSLD